MRIFKFLPALLLTVPLMAETIKTVPPALIASKDTDYSTSKPLVITREGTYVCGAGWIMAVIVRVPNEVEPNNTLYPVPDGSRLISSDKRRFIPTCLQVK